MNTMGHIIVSPLAGVQDPDFYWESFLPILFKLVDNFHGHFISAEVDSKLNCPRHSRIMAPDLFKITQKLQSNCPYKGIVQNQELCNYCP